MGIFQKVKNLFSKEPPPSLEELRDTFRKKYHAFRLLLATNNAALHLLTELELALQGNHSFGMTFIRSNTNTVHLVL
jgi:pyruvate,water dikinase